MSGSLLDTKYRETASQVTLAFFATFFLLSFFLLIVAGTNYFEEISGISYIQQNWAGAFVVFFGTIVLISVGLFGLVRYDRDRVKLLVILNGFVVAALVASALVGLQILPLPNFLR